VNDAIAALPEELRTAITLRELDGLSYEEIAQIMNCPIGTVRSRIFRAREAVAEKAPPAARDEQGQAVVGKRRHRRVNNEYRGRRPHKKGSAKAEPDYRSTTSS
jgi:transposase